MGELQGQPSLVQAGSYGALAAACKHESCTLQGALESRARVGRHAVRGGGEVRRGQPLAGDAVSLRLPDAIAVRDSLARRVSLGSFDLSTLVGTLFDCSSYDRSFHIVCTLGATAELKMWVEVSERDASGRLQVLVSESWRLSDLVPLVSFRLRSLHLTCVLLLGVLWLPRWPLAHGKI